MDNLARKIDISKYYDKDEIPYKGRKVNIEEFEFMIRQDEAKKWIELRRKERERQRRRKEAQKDLFLLTLFPRIIGLLSIIISLIPVLTGFMIDGGYLLITVPLGILLMISPGYNKVPNKDEKYDD